MTDLEMTRLCAEAMGYRWRSVENMAGEAGVIEVDEGAYWYAYLPLGNDAQAMALVKQFSMEIFAGHNTAIISWPSRRLLFKVSYADTLNRAIVECVAKMQTAKTPA